MISLVVSTVLLLIHVLVCLVLWTLMKLGLLPVRGHMLAVMVLVPLWGPLLVVLLSVRSAVFGDDLKDATLEALRINDDMHRSMLVQGREGDDGVVPLEEALIVNDPGDRRRLMLSMLTEDPDAYLAQLQAAKLNDDVEVAHYAATAVAQISKESDLKLQQLERAFKTDPSAQNLNAYCDYLGTYLASGLAEGRVAQIQRQQYARLLARRCEREDGLALRVRYATALADAGEVDEAEDVAERLVADTPDEQDVWMLCLRLAVLRHDGEMVRRVIDAVDKQHVYLSAENREKLAFCVKERRPDERGATCPRPCGPFSLDGAARGMGGLYCHGRRAVGGASRRTVQRRTAQAGHARRQRRGAGLLGDVWPKAHVPRHFRYRPGGCRGRKRAV